jgi:hypothetical protein
MKYFYFKNTMLMMHNVMMTEKIKQQANSNWGIILRCYNSVATLVSNTCDMVILYIITMF